MRKISLTILGAALIVASCKKEGCTDPLANNYNKKATQDDGTCTYDDDVISEEITEDITSNTTIEDKTVSVCGDIYVSADLTIEPGATFIMCAGASITIEETASINAVGTASNPIVFKGETETAGFWEGISIKSNNPNNKLHFVTVKDAGTYWGWEYANVFVGSNAKLDMQNSTIANSDDVGLFVSESASLVNFTNNTFSNCQTGLNIHAKQVDEIDVASNYNDGNDNDYIFVRSGTLTQNATWPATTTPLLIKGAYIEADLTLSPGIELLMEADAYLQVENTGSLNAVGSSSNPIVITGRVQSAGYWEGIKINSNNPLNNFDYVTVSYGGAYWGYEYANIDVDGSLVLNNSTISNANSWGLNVGSSASITVNGVVQTDAAGVESNNTFTSNGSGADANCTGGCGVNFQ